MRNHIYQLICDEKTYISVGSEGRRDRSIRDKEPGGWAGHLASFLNVSDYICSDVEIYLFGFFNIFV